MMTGTVLIKNILVRAVEYATAASNTGGQHEGEAWHLLVHFTGGSSAEVAVAKDPVSNAYRYERGRGDGIEAPAGEPVFMNLDAITHVEVLWI